MKRLTKRIVSFLMIGIMMLGMTSCSSCSRNQGDSSSNSDSEYQPPETSENEYFGEKKYVVKDGSANYCIVIPETATLAISNAGKEIINYVNQSTGVTLKMYKDNEEIPERYRLISLGKTKYLDKAGFQLDYKLNGDGFYMWTKDENLYIEADMDRGVLNGAYEFLERFVGVKFLAFDYYYVPKNTEVAIFDMKITEVPTFEERDMFVALPNSDVMSKQRCVDPYGYNTGKYGEGYNQYWNTTGHTSVQVYLPTDKYYADHPDWYDAAGKQVNPTSGLDENDNYTGDVNSGIYTTIQNIKTEIINNPTQKYFFIGQEDTGISKNQAIQDSLERNGDSLSAVWMIYINTIAKEIDKWVKEVYTDREVYIGTFAYQWTVVPPVKKVENADGSYSYEPINEKVVPPDNVFIQFTPMGACWYHDYMDKTCPTNQMFATYLEGWGSICDSFICWDYQTNYSNYLAWFPHYNSMKKNYETYSQLGFWRIVNQHSTGEYYYYQNILDAYIGHKIMWDINLNVDDLIKEFNYYYFGEKVAPYVDKFVDLMQTNYAMINSQTTTCVDIYDSVGMGSMRAELYPIDLLEKGLGLIRTAIEEVDSLNFTQSEKDALKVRLGRVIVQPLYMILVNFNSYYDPSLKYDYAKDFIYYGELIGLQRIYEGGAGSFAEYKAALGF